MEPRLNEYSIGMKLKRERERERGKERVWTRRGEEVKDERTNERSQGVEEIGGGGGVGEMKRKTYKTQACT